MKKILALVLVWILCMNLLSCRQEKEPVDYTEKVLGIWYAVEYENEVVEFRADGTVSDTWHGTTTYGDWFVDNENALIWCNFGDDVFSIQIAEADGKYILLDNNGTMVRPEDLETYRNKG